MRLLYLVVLFAFFESCGSGRVRSIVIDNHTKAEGEISKDTVFNGSINFYDLASNSLTEKAYYRNGVQDSTDILYHANGKVSVERSFKNGELNGYTYIYDPNGALSRKDYYYYGLRVGNCTEYQNNKIKYYRFNSLENGILFFLDYDSIKGRKLPELQSGFFFYHQGEYKNFEENDSVRRKEYFLFTPNPPKFNFQYSLVIVDSTRKVLSELQQFDNTKPWTMFEHQTGTDTLNKKLAVRLVIRDSTNNVNITMLKNLH